MAKGISEVGATHLSKTLRPPWVQRSLPPQVIAPVRVRFAKPPHEMSRQVAEVRSMVGTKPATGVVWGDAAPKEVAAVNIAMAPSRPTMYRFPLVSSAPTASQAPPAPTTFKTIGYVEKAGGQLEAIILQENQVQVVHIGERIAGRYLVTKITPDLVEAVDEALVQSPMAKLAVAKSDVLATNGAEQASSPSSAATVQPEVMGVAEEGAHPAPHSCSGTDRKFFRLRTASGWKGRRCRG